MDVCMSKRIHWYVYILTQRAYLVYNSVEMFIYTSSYNFRLFDSFCWLQKVRQILQFSFLLLLAYVLVNFYRTSYLASCVQILEKILARWSNILKEIWSLQQNISVNSVFWSSLKKSKGVFMYKETKLRPLVDSSTQRYYFNW